MTKKTNFDKLFETIDFDIEQPNEGHEARFLKKLNNSSSEVTPIVSIKTSKTSFWKPFMGIAASIVLLIGLTFSFTSNNKLEGLASVSPEMAETQHFFKTTISNELSKLKEENSPEAKQIVADAILRLNDLEANYEQLKIDLKQSGDDKLVIYAMIKNFQNRIEILQHTLEEIEKIKEIKTQNYENNSVI